MEFCIYKCMLNEKYTDVSVMNRQISCMGCGSQEKTSMEVITLKGF